MRTNRRWLNSVLNEATKSNIKMPWAHGKRRIEMASRRAAPIARKVSASA
ncbi:MAG: hypothetical protein WBN04_07800 [Paracoccaceae bacterium]